MQKFAGGGWQHLAGKSVWLKLCLIIGLAGLAAGAATAQPTNDTFANATTISGLSGSTDANNTGALTESGESVSIITDDNAFGVSVGASIWYSWTAPATGNVTFNTFPTNNTPPYDTVLAVYTGNSLGNLSLVGGNDDAPGVTNGTSLVTFYANAGTTYFIEVAGFNSPPVAQGDTSLNWSTTVPGFSAGTFRFTSTSYTAGNFESFPVYGPKPPMSGTPGARVSVTRVGGSAGKVQVHYTVTNTMEGITTYSNVDIENQLVETFDTNGNTLNYNYIFATNYLTYTVAVGISGGVITNIPCNATGYTFIETNNNGNSTYGIQIYPQQFIVGTNLLTYVTNSDGTITGTLLISDPVVNTLTNLVPSAIAENPKNVNQPWDYLPATGILTFNDYEMTKDIYVTLSTNNYFVETPVAVQVTLDSAVLDTNELQSIPPPTIDSSRSNAIVNVESLWQAPYSFSGLCPGFQSYDVTNLINFIRSTVRVDRNGGTASIAVNRGGVDISQAITIYYSIDYGTANANYNTFTLQSGSDYAIPDNALKTAPEGVVDFTNTGIGSISWGVNDPFIKYIQVPIVNNNTVEFNKDFVVQFYADSGHQWSQGTIPGNISTCTVTILYEKQPAGAADETYNLNNVNSTVPPFNQNPGANGPVNAVLVQPDGNTLIGGSFSSYNSTNSYNIARALANGQADAGFIRNTGLGADGFIDALALDISTNIYIGGAFTSFNGVQRNGIAHLNFNGTLDNTQFLPGSGADGTVTAIAIQPNGQILAAGNFTTFNNTNRNCLVRLNPDGSVDPTFDPGTGALDEYDPGSTSINCLSLQPNGQIVIGGDFTTYGGVGRNYIARLNANGTLDTSFDPGNGANDVVNAVAVDTNGLVLVVGAFTQLGALGTSAGIARLNSDGSLDTTFNVGSGANDVVNTIALQPDGGILVGGTFTSINQTRRVGIARLYGDGSLDTTFMDTAYNQFAGLINPYYDPAVNAPNAVYAVSQQADGNIIIGGSFYQIGGGTTRNSILPRSNVARLIGGTTPGPGNIGLAQANYSVDASSGTSTNATLTVTINRTNGTLGPAAATVEPVSLGSGPGNAIYGTDYLFNSTVVTFGTTWSSTWMLSDGVAGPNYNTTLTAYNNSRPNAALDLQMTAPVGSDIFFLGGNNKKTGLGLFNSTYQAQDGENIPLGVALGRSVSPLNIIHNVPKPGVLSFTTATYTTNQNAGVAIINVTRANGSYGQVTVNYTTINGTAKAGVDYTAKAGKLTFAAGVTNAIFTVPLINTGIAQPDRYLSLLIYNTSGGATLGSVTNAQLLLINNNYANGHVSFTGGVAITNTSPALMAYGTNENSGTLLLTVARQGGSSGVLNVSVASSGGTATNGVNYTGFTNVLTWQNNQSQPQTIAVPVKDDGIYTSNLTVNVRLYNTIVNGLASSLALGGVYTNSVLIISNVDFPGTLAFSAPTYSFNENGGSAIIPVIRSGGSAGTISAQFSTVDGTAVAGTQYVATNGTLVFTNGQVSQNFRVPIIDNMVQDVNYAFSLQLTNAANSSYVGSPSNSTLTIVNNETYNYPPGQIDTSYNPAAGFSGPVFALALEPSDNKLLVGGGFTNANGVARNYIARLNTDGTLDQKFSSYLPGQGAGDVVRSVVVETNGAILVGGFFTNFNGYSLNHIARLTYSGGLDSTFNPGSGSDSPIYALAQSFLGGQSVLYVGGAFTTFNGSSRNGITRLTDGGAVDINFNPGTGANGTVYALGVQADGRVVIGGDFTAVNGIPLNHVARLNVDGSVDMTFVNALSNTNNGASGSVHSLAIQLDGNILIGGLFTNVDGVAFNHIARLNSNGTVDTTFTPGVGANGDVLTISLQSDTRILLGGNFTTCNGVTRNRVTRLNPDGTVDPTINFGTGADSFVAASVIQPDGNILLGGGFLNFEGTPHAGLVRVYGGSAAGSGNFQFTSATYQTDQTNGVALITVQRFGGTSGTNVDNTGHIYLNFNTQNGTAIAGTNYLAVNTNLDFPAGEVLKTVLIPLINVVGVNPNLTVNLAITNPTPPSVLGNQPSAVLTIINSGSAVSLLSSNYSVAKNAINGAGIITLIRQGSTNGTCSVNFATVPGGTAVIGTDYTPVAGTVTFNPGESQKSFQVPVNNNGIPEGNRTVNLVIGNASGTLLYNPTNAVMTIIDTVQAPGVLAFSATNYNVLEGGGVGYSAALVTVVRTNGSSGIISVGFGTQDGTALNGLKYLSTNGVLTFGDGVTSQSFVVRVINTTTAEGPQYVNLFLTNSTGGAGFLSPTNATVTIVNTNVGLAFVAATNYFTEPFGQNPGTVALNVIRYNNTNGVTTVNYTNSGITAFAGTNYAGATASGTLTFNPGETIKTITVVTLYDPRVTGDLYFTVGLTSPSAGAQLTSPASTTVVDHDANAGLSFLVAADSVYQNAGNEIVYVLCSNTNVQPVSVNYATTPGSALPGSDYTTTAGTLTFTNGQNISAFLVPIQPNNQVGSNKTFTVSLSNPTGSGVLVPPSVETITILRTNTPYGLSFASPIQLSGDWGSVTANNTLGVPETGDPTIAGNPPTAPVWFQWTAPASGEVTLDTIGSVTTNGLKLDTVLGVYTGSKLGSLSQIAVDDDILPQLYPTAEPYLGQINQDAQNIYNTNSSAGPNAFQTIGVVNANYLQPFGGPSILRFNAQAGVTYYFAADTKLVAYNAAPYPYFLNASFNTRGLISLNWSYHPSGVFRFASEQTDLTGLSDTNGNPILLYQCAETESSESQIMNGTFNVDEAKTVVNGTYYHPYVAGLLVTVTRVAGSSGRVSVNYTTQNGNPLQITNGDSIAYSNVDYVPVSGTLIFDDFEMSKTIKIPILYNQFGQGGQGGGFGQNGAVPQPNRDFTVVLSNPQRDPQESSVVAPPRVDSIFGNVLCRILDCNIDPKGPSTFSVITTNFFTGTTNVFYTTNQVISLIPTNPVINFAKTAYRIPRDENKYFGIRNTNTTVPITVYVYRFGTNRNSITLHWRLDSQFLQNNGPDDSDYQFPLQPASDYAVPTPATTAGVYGTNSDFAGVGGDSGTITFPAKTSQQNQGQTQKIQFNVNNNNLTEFNRDVKISLYDLDANGNPIQDGMNEQTVVTILTDDGSPAAGSVDELYNPDLAVDMAFPVYTNNSNLGSSVVNPGTELYSEVYSLVVLPTNGVTSGNQALIAGAFTTYTDPNNTYTVNGIARLNYDGTLDTTFNPGSGVNVFPGGEFIRAAQLTANNQILIAGDLSSYNGTQRNSVARLNANGSLDTTFNPGSGVNGTVWAMVQQPDGRIVIAGDFTRYNNSSARYVARLNTDGTLDTTFNAGTNLNAAVYAVALDSNTNIILGGAFTLAGGPGGQNRIVRLTPAGAVDPTFNTVTGPNATVRALAIQPDGRILAGGEFTQVAGQADNYIVRFNTNGALDTTFNAGSGTDGTVYDINYVLASTNSTSGDSVYVGGSFTSFNGTHRLGFARLYADGTVDTTFLDTAYNQFAGLPRIFYGDAPGTVYASGVQDDGNVLIAGSFSQVGGGQADENVRNYLERERGLVGSFSDTNLLVNQDNTIEPKSRDGVRNRGNVARLIGGSTAGPGNIGMVASSYAVNKTQSVAPVTLVRTNGSLGYASANFAVIPGLAQSGSDFSNSCVAPFYPIEWNYFGPSRNRFDGLYGPAGLMNDKYGTLWKFGFSGPSAINVTIFNNTSSAGNLSAQLQLANPQDVDQFFLGGQNIPVGVALGESLAPLTLVDNTHQDGVFGFAASSFVATNSPATITIARTNSSFGTVQVSYQTVTNGSTAVASVDYVFTNGVVTFNPSQNAGTFPITVLENSYISSVEKAVKLNLYNVQDLSGGNASLGQTNTYLRIINPNYQGYLNLSSNYYTANLNAGSISFVVQRTVGSKGTLAVQYATTNGTALNGVDYVGATNTLVWNSGDVSPRLVTIPLIGNANAGGSAKQFGVTLLNATLNNTNWPSLLLAPTAALMNIYNDNSYGTFQFSAAKYQVNDNGGYANITVTRSGSALGSAQVGYSTTNGTALASINYYPTSGTLNFAPGQLSTNFTVQLIPDTVPEPPPASFYFGVVLTTNSTGSGLGSPAAATVNIVDSLTFNQPPGAIDTSFNPNLVVNGPVLALAQQANGQIVLGGLFTAVNGAALNHVARLNYDGSLDTSFLSGLAGADGNVNALVSQTDSRILLGGAFANVNGITRNGVARLMTDGTLDTSFVVGSGADNSVFALAETFINGSRALYVGGGFSTFNGASSPGVIRLNNSGTQDTSFRTGIGAGGTVYAITAYPTNSVYNNGSVLVGGSFTNFNSVVVGNLVRLNVNGAVDTNFSFNFGANGTVRAISLQTDGKIIIGGDFTTVNGQTVNRLARINNDGTLDTSFAANLLGGVNGSVDAIGIQPDARIVVAGQFNQASSLNRNNITRLNPDGTVDPNINFGDGANGAINAVVIQATNNFLLLGGAFTQFQDKPVQYITRVNGGSIVGSGQFSFSVANYQVAENGGFATITVVRSGGSSGPTNNPLGDVYVTFATTNGTAVNGVNYTGATNILDFALGQVFQTITVPVQDDQAVTPNLTVNLALSNPTGGSGLGDQSSALLTIINVDSGVSFSSANYSVPKNTVTGVANIDITRLGSTSGTCSVYFTTVTNGTAVIGTDYYPTNGTITFNPGISDITVQVPIINNTLPEGQRTVAMIITNATGFILTSPTNATLTIIDTVNAPGQLFFSTNSYTVVKANGNAILTVSRTNGASGSVSVNYNTTAGTALPGVNYLTSSGTLTMGDGVTSGNITIPIVDNTIAQGTVNFTVNLFNPGGGATLLTPTNATVNILDHNVGVSFLNLTNYASQPTPVAIVAVQRIGATNTAFAVSYVTTNLTALAGSNYVAVANTLHFAAGQSLQNISVPLINNPLVTGDLQFGMYLTNVTSGAQLVAPTNTVVIIHASSAGISFDSPATNVLKNAGSVTLEVICSNPSIEPVIVNSNSVPLQVNYSTTNGTAVAGMDYTAVSGTLVFTNGLATNIITVPILNNGVLEGNRTLNVVLSAPTAPGLLVPPSTTTVTIIDINSGVEFSSPTYTVLKTGIQANINVYRTGYTNSIVSVNYATTNGTAQAGINYVATSGSLLFTNGVTSQSFSVPIISSTVVQPDLTLFLQLSDATNAALTYPSFSTLTIQDLSGSLVVPSGAIMVEPEGFSPPNGIIDPGERNTVLFGFRDSSGTNVGHLVATLLATNGVSSPSGPQNYGPLVASGPTVSRPFTFTANGTNGQAIVATFALADGTKSLGTNTFTFYLGTWSTSYSNTAPIIINDFTTASPYPATINVSGLSGVVLKTTVTLTNLTHTAPGDIGALVVAPNQQDTLIMNNAGAGNSIKNVTLTFDDSASNNLPLNLPVITSGTNKPTSYPTIKAFP